MPPTSRAPSAERPQPGAFAAQLQEACEGGSCDCSDDSLADSEDDEDIAEDEARQFTESRSVEADEARTNAALATDASARMCEASSGRRDRQQPPELPGSPGTYGGDLTAALDHLIAVGGAAQAAELAVAAKADAVLFAAEVGLELSGMRCGKSMILSPVLRDKLKPNPP
jgi:hypothetical protein